MRRIAEGGDMSRDLAWRTLSWIVHAADTRPIKMNELRQLLVIDVGDTQIDERQSSAEDIIAVCQSLIALDVESNVVRFAHFTVQEFLTEKYTHYKLLPRKELSKVCVTCLTLDVFETGPTDEEAFYRRAETHLCYEYAVKCWGYFTRGDGENDPEIHSALLKLFKSAPKRAVLRQQALLLQAPEWHQDKIWSLSVSELSAWMPIHIIAHEGLSILFFNFASPAYNEVSIPKLDRLETNSRSQEIDGGTIQSRDNYGSTAFIEAAKSGYIDMVELLLECGADIEAKDDYGQTSLIWAAENGNAEVLKQLLEAGADVEAKNNRGLRSLILAVKIGHAEVVKQLLEAGADIEAKDDDGWTPLFWAARNRYIEMVKQLLEAGADIESKDDDGWTPLFWAATLRHTEMVKQLLEAGADIEAKDHRGQTSLLWAAKNGHAEVVKQLLEAGAEIEAKDYGGQTLPRWIANNGHAEVVKQLLEGVDIEAKEEDGLTSLLSAAWNGHAEVVKHLLNAGADIEAKDDNGLTSLLLAALYGHAEVVKQLLEAGADSALVRRVRKGRNEAVDQLLEAIADIEASDAN